MRQSAQSKGLAKLMVAGDDDQVWLTLYIDEKKHPLLAGLFDIYLLQGIGMAGSALAFQKFYSRFPNASLYFFREACVKLHAIFKFVV